MTLPGPAQWPGHTHALASTGGGDERGAQRTATSWVLALHTSPAPLRKVGGDLHAMVAGGDRAVTNQIHTCWFPKAEKL